MPSVSIIVPVRNEAKSIESTLRSLLTQDYPAGAYEVIVADGFSTDATVAIVRRLQGEYSNLKLVYNASRLSSAGRNTAVRHMTGDCAVIVDGHCQVPDANYVRNVADAFTTSGAAALGRPQPLGAPVPTAFQSAVSIARACKLGHNPSSDIYSDEPKFVDPQSTAVAYRREVFQEIGLFDERFDACEDVEFNHRVHKAGMNCWFSPTLKIVYHPRASVVSLFRQLSRYGCGRARLAAKHPESLTLPALVPPLWVLWLVGGAIMSLFSPWLMVLTLASVAFYLTTLGAASCFLGRKLPLATTVRMPAVFLGIHFGFAWGFLREMSRQLRR